MQFEEIFFASLHYHGSLFRQAVYKTAILAGFFNGFFIHILQLMFQKVICLFVL